MFSCKKATERMSRALDGKLGIIEKLSLFMHKVMCYACRNFEKQISFLNRLIKQDEFGTENENLSEEAKEKIIKQINNC